MRKKSNKHRYHIHESHVLDKYITDTINLYYMKKKKHVTPKNEKIKGFKTHYVHIYRAKIHALDGFICVTIFTSSAQNHENKKIKN